MAPSVFPKYCNVHRTEDICWLIEVKPQGGGNEQDR